jgi:uncharacterized protein
MPFDVTVTRDVRIPTENAEATLSADLYIPRSDEKIPALVSLLPYRNDAASGIEFDATLRWFASHGYACLLVDFRGTGASDGQQRPPFDPQEADDAVDVINWAAHQPWCSGKVAMWGMSYGAIVTLRVAAGQPKHLTAILSIEGALDPERDFVHPSGSGGCLGALGMWGAETLLNQLLPPLHEYGAAAQQKRWRYRQRVAEPWLVDIVRHGPGHHTWRSRAIDASSIAIPTLIVAGWRDLFCDSSLRAYESIQAPKKLLVGPWMHTLPDVASFEPIDFRGTALRWWDHWLKGKETGLMNENPVTIFVQGARPEWRNLPAWLPDCTRRLFITEGSLTLQEPLCATNPDAKAVAQIADWRADPTVGTLSGLWAIPTSGFGLPVDQHGDDTRSVSCTTEAISEDLTVVGRPIVRIKWVEVGSPERLVVRLTDVDDRGVSILISVGVISSPQAKAMHELALNPTCYRIQRGHRIRVTIGEADFPRLWPFDMSIAANRSPLKVLGVEVEVRSLHDSKGSIVTLPRPGSLDSESGPLALQFRPTWKIVRSEIPQSVEVAVGQFLIALTPNREHLLEIDGKVEAKVSSDRPEAASASATYVATVRMKSGETIVVWVHTHLTCGTVHASARITIDSDITFSREWSVP